MKLFFIPIILGLMIGCSSSKKAKSKLTEESYINSVVHDRFRDEPVEKIFNHDRDYVILIHRVERGTGYPAATDFAIVDLADKKVLYFESVNDGKITWIDNDRVLIKRVPEVRSKNSEENEKIKSKEINVRDL